MKYSITLLLVMLCCWGCFDKTAKAISQWDCIGRSVIAQMPVIIDESSFILCSGCDTFIVSELEMADTVKVYYYWWTANFERGLAFGENNVALNHKPTKKEIKEIVFKFIGNDSWIKKYLIVEDIIEFKNYKAYREWNRGAPIQEIANQIRLYRLMQVEQPIKPLKNINKIQPRWRDSVIKEEIFNLPLREWVDSAPVRKFKR